MNDQPSFVFSFEHLRDDLVEGNDFRFHPGSEQLQRQVSGGQRARHRNLFGFDFARGERPWRNDHGPIAFAHTAAASHQRVFILHVGIGVKRNCANIIDAFARLLVQRLDIAERMGESAGQACGLYSWPGHKT